MTSPRLSPASLFAVAALLSACQSTYYHAMEQLGYQKRDILVHRVEVAREDQQAAKQQFESALERFTHVVDVQGGDLEKKYDALRDDYEASARRAEAVHKRVDQVDEVAQALFGEWKNELNQYSNAELRRSSARKLAQTQRRYAQLIGAMRRAEKKMDPVLAAFHDQVLFLKHNLNARAIAALKDEYAGIRTDVAALVREMETSIREANAFIDDMEKG